MTLEFHKYHGAGNDFVLIDNRSNKIYLSQEGVAYLCDRHMGIGADGLMLLQNEADFDFRMIYYNSDGRESTMCGNGGRCITAFAQKLGLVDKEAHFIAVDGPHRATVNEDGTISLQMQNVTGIYAADGHMLLNTGSPHYVLWVNDVQQTDVYTEGKRIRNLHEYQPDGINVNFVQLYDGKLWVRTYERGVEDETLSCGTGVTASAIAATANATGMFHTPVHTPGGVLRVSFTKNTPRSAEQVVLTGPVQYVFQGTILL